MPIFTSIAIAIGGALGFAATSFFVTATAFALKTIVGLGVNMLISKLLMPKGPTFHIQGKLRAGDTIPRSILMGYIATAGSLVYANTWGRSGKTPNAYFTQVMALSDMPIGSLDGIFIGGERCTIDIGSPHVDYGYPIEEYRVDGHDYLWVKFYDGTQTTADQFLIDKVSSTDRPYTANRIGYGIAYAIITARIKDDLFTSFPEAKFECTGMKLYDISKDDTAGGSGTHRLNNPATWGGDGDELLGVQLYNILRGISYNGEWLYGLQRTDAYSLPNAWWIEQINKCRATFEGPDSTLLPSYRTSIEIPVSEAPADVCEALLLGGNGKLTESGGIYKLYLGEPGSPVVAIDDDIILTTYEQSFIPFYGLNETITGIVGSYPEPDEAWNSKSLEPLYKQELEELAGNRRLMGSVAVNTVPYSPQVQRIIKAALFEAERARRHTIVMPPEYWIYEPGDVITWTSNRNGYDAKLFRIDGVQDLDNLDVMWDITEVDPSDYDWDPDTDYRPPIIGPIGPIRPTPQPVGGWQVFADDIRDNNGTPRRPTIGVQFDGDDDDIAYARITVRLAVTEEVIFNVDIPYGNPDTNPALRYELLNGVFTPATDYEVQGEYIPISERRTQPTVWLPVTTNNTGLSNEDLDPTPPDPVTDLAVDSAGFRILALSWTNPASENLGTVDLYYNTVNNFATAEFGNSFRGESGILNLPDTGQLYYVWAVAVSQLGVEQEGGPTGPVTGTTLLLPGEMINDDAIIASKIADEAITNLKLAAEAVTETKIATGAVLQSKLADNAVTVAKLADNAVTFAKIVDGAVGSLKLADGAVIAGKIADGAVSNTKLANLAVDASKLATNAVTETKIADGSITTPKIVSNAIVSDLIAANAITVEKLKVTGAGNSLNVDPNFEDDTYWTNPTSADISIFQYTGSAKYTGNYALRIIGSGAAYWQNPKIPIESQKTYLIRFVMRRVGSADGVVYATAQFWDASGNLITDTYTEGWPGQHGGTGRYYFVNNETPPATYTSYNLSVGPDGVAAIPAGAVAMSFAILSGYGGTGTSDVLIGWWSLSEMMRGELVVDGAITTAKLDALAVTAEKIAAKSITVEKLAVTAGGDNLHADPNFEDAQLWLNPATVGGTGTISRQTTTVYAGAQALRLQGTGTAYWDQYKIPIDTARTYLLRVVMRRVGALDGGVYLTWRFWDSSGNHITGVTATGWASVNSGSGNFYQTANVDPTLSYSPFVLSLGPMGIAQYPAGAAFISFGLLYGYNGGGANDLRLGWVNITEMARGELIVDGAITAAKIEANSITTAHIQAGSITANELATNSVTAIKIQAASITGVKIAAETITGDKIAANTIYGDRIVSQSITSRELIVGNFDNLIQNPGAEVSGSSLAPHATSGSWSIGSVTRSGARSFQLSGTSGILTLNGPRTTTTDHPFASFQDQFYFEFYARTSSNTAEVRCLVRWMDATGAIISSLTSAYSTVTSSSWSRINVDGSAPSNTAYVVFEVQVNGGTASAVRIDDCYARRMMAGTLIVDGTIIAAKIAALSITADRIAAGAITTDKLDANAVTAAKINANSVFSVTATISGTLTVGSNIFIQGASNRILVTD